MRSRCGVLASVIVLLAAGCGDDDSSGAPDAGTADAGYPIVTTDHCEYAPLSPTAGAGGTVEPGALQAGAAEAVLPVPVGTALGSYTGRADFLGSAGKIDSRNVELPGAFNPSVGVETAPRVKAVALEAGGEKLVILKSDIGFTWEGHNFELEQRLGADYHGKVMIAVSHTHSGWGQYSGHEGIGGVGAGRRRDLVVDRFLDAYEDAARAAIANLRPARLGVAVDDAFDPDDRINRDRRGDNDDLAGGPEDDHHLFVLRVDGADGAPIAVGPIFGEHGTLMDQDTPYGGRAGVGGGAPCPWS